MQSGAHSGEAAVGDISGLLHAWSDGDQAALEKLTPIVFDEFHRLARRYMRRERLDHSLQATDLVNEAYMRLVGGNRAAHQVALDDALNALARLDARKVQLVEMRFFGGLSVEETADVLHVSPVTVMRDWSTAKAWLHRELAGGTGDGLQSMEANR
jgi:DNA-directed RNA polymerase specialized sigma24 family protein